MSLTQESAPFAPELGKYRLIADLARGGMGNIYLGVAQGPGGFNKLVAVKELKPEFTEDETFVAMFLEEARLAARLTHPNIVQTNEVGSDGQRHYMIMEYLDGRSLYRASRHLARRGTPLPLGAHIRVIAEALQGLHYAHELRGYNGELLDIVHRDVSPLNVLITFDGQVKVLDFGIAKAADSALETQAGVLKGRIAYMAPEQAVGGKVDRRADVYATGVMLWEAAAGRRMWEDKNEVEILTRMVRDGAPRLRSVCPETPEKLDAICSRALAPDSAERYPTAAALLEDLELFLAGRADAPSLRDIGAMIRDSFEDERARMRAIVDEAISRARTAGPRSGVMHASGPTSTSGVSISRTREVGEGLLEMSSLLAATPSRAMPAPERSIHARPVFEPENPPRARRLPWLAAGGLALFAVTCAAMGLVAARSGDAKAPAVASARAAASPNALAPPAAEASLIDVTVRVFPVTASIAIDGAIFQGNPVHARLPRDHETHRISATADGFEPKTDDVVFAGDVSIDVSLERRAARAGPARGWPPPAPIAPAAVQARAPRSVPDQAPRAAALGVDPPAPAPAPRTEPDVNAGRPPQRSIVTTNPYGAP